MSISVRCEVPVYEDNGVVNSNRVIVESVDFESNMVNITFSGITFKVCGSEISEAVNKCMRSSSVWTSI